MAYVGTPSYLGNDIDTLASIIQGEAGGEGLQGMQAVANVIQNRANNNFSGYGTSPVAQALARKQFQGQGRAGPAARSVAEQLVSGQLPDVTGGALYYANPVDSTAGWARRLNSGNALKIGNHYFTDNDQGTPFQPSAVGQTIAAPAGGAPAVTSGGGAPNAAAAAAAAKLPPTPPAPTAPGGFLSALGSLLVGAANASPAASVPSLNAPMHAPTNNGDPLGLGDQTTSPLDPSGQTAPAANSAPSQGSDNPMPSNTFSDMMDAMDRLARRSSGVPVPDTPAGKMSLNDILFGDAAKPGWKGLTNALAPDTAKYVLQPPPAPVQGPNYVPQTLPADRPMPGGPIPSPVPGQPTPLSPDGMLSRPPVPGPGTPTPLSPDGMLSLPHGGPVGAQSLPPDRPMPGGPMAQGNLNQPVYPPDPTLPDTAPIPTPNPGAKKFDTLGFLGALGGLVGALGTGSPELPHVSLSAPVHNPGPFQGLPWPKGLLG